MYKLNLILRQGETSDLAELQELFTDTVKKICIADYNEQQIEAWVSNGGNKQRWNEIITTQIVIVAQCSNKIIGFITLKDGNYIDLLYIHAEHQREGTAQQLLNAITNEAIRLKQPQLISDVSKTARPFFERNGFYVLTEQIVEIKNTILTNYKMVKSIDK